MFWLQALNRSNVRILLLIILSATTCAASVRDNEILYVGGTVTTVPKGVIGRFAFLDKNSAEFVSPNGVASITYKSIVRLGYGEKITRRILEAVTVSWLFIFTQRHQHLVSIEFASKTGEMQVAVFEVGKDNIDAVVTVFENRSGLKFEFESKQAERDCRKRNSRQRLDPSVEGDRQ